MSALIYFTAPCIRYTQRKKPGSQLSDILLELSTVALLVRGDIWYKIIINKDHQAASPINYFVDLWIKTLFFLIFLLPQKLN
jgi:hypothetical protein